MSLEVMTMDSQGPWLLNEVGVNIQLYLNLTEDA